MGLDMYAFAINEGEKYSDKEVEKDEVFYWRKHNALHAWMEKKWREDGGDGVFNCAPFELSIELLDELEKDIRERNLEPTEGFFFGGTRYSDEDWERHEREDMEFIVEARIRINKGQKVFYDSWW